MEGFECGPHAAIKVEMSSATEVIVLRATIRFIVRLFRKGKLSLCDCVRENLVLHANLAITKCKEQQLFFAEWFAAAAEIMYEIKRFSISRKRAAR